MEHFMWLWPLSPSDILCLVAFTAAFGGTLLALDDLIIDILALVFKVRPKHLTEEDLQRMASKPQKKIAIMIANWQEEAVIGRMVMGNLERIDYDNYVIYLGVYLNDLATVKAARLLVAEYPKVRMIVNSRPGPTTKGQMLNEIVRSIMTFENPDGAPDYLLMQDSEDILHPLALKMINDATDGYDFVQTPVFSFTVPASCLIGGTYMDEFSEGHTKDLLVRARVGAAIPSAGVGTALSKSLVLTAMHKLGGSLLREDTLTEDYDLGFMAKRLGFTSRFICPYIKKSDGTRDLVATREYFPSHLRASMRQRSRWTLGIIFQGWRNLGWRVSWKDRYFLFRDRRGILNALFLTLGWITVCFVVGHWTAYETVALPPELNSDLFIVPASGNLINLVYRMFRRMRSVAFVHSWKEAAMVPPRWLVGNLMNVLAVGHAIYRQSQALYHGVAPKWEKTKHFLPESFGLPQISTARRKRETQNEEIQL